MIIPFDNSYARLPPRFYALVNPLVNIANTRRIGAVLIDGRLYDRDRLDDQLTFVREQANSVSNWLKLLWGFAASSVSGEL